MDDIPPYQVANYQRQSLQHGEPPNRLSEVISVTSYVRKNKSFPANTLLDFL